MVNTHRILKEALGHAVKWGLLRYNPADGVDAPKVQKTEMRTLSEEETIRLLGAAATSPIVALVQTAVFTGMRRSELLGLRWGDIDLDLAAIQVRRGLHALRGGTLHYEEPKSRHSRRKIDLPPLAVAALRRHRQQMEILAAELGLGIKDQTPVFCRRDLSPSSIQITLDLYSHVAPGMQQAAALRFEDGLVRAGLDRGTLSSRS